MLVSINLLPALGLMAWLCQGTLDSSIAARDSAIGALGESAASSAGIEAPPVIEGDWYLLFSGIQCNSYQLCFYDLNGTNEFLPVYLFPDGTYVTGNPFSKDHRSEVVAPPDFVLCDKY